VIVDEVVSKGGRVIFANKTTTLPTHLTKRGSKVLLLEFTEQEWKAAGEEVDEFKNISWIECVQYGGRKVLQSHYRILAHHKFQDQNDDQRYIHFGEKFANHFYYCAASGCGDGKTFLKMLWNFKKHVLGDHRDCTSGSCKKAGRMAPEETEKLPQYIKEVNEMMGKLIPPTMNERMAECYRNNYFTSSVESFNNFLNKYCTKDGQIFKAELGRTLCAVGFRLVECVHVRGWQGRR